MAGRSHRRWTAHQIANASLLAMGTSVAAYWTACASERTKPAASVTQSRVQTASHSIAAGELTLTAGPTSAAEHEHPQLTSLRVSGARPVGLTPELEVGGRPVPLRAGIVSVRSRGGRTELGAEQVSTDGRLALRSTFAFHSETELHVHMEATHRGATPVHATVGLGAEWPGRPAFAPGVGFEPGPATRSVPWVAREFGHGTYLLVTPSGPAKVTVLADHVGHHGVVTWAPRATLDPRRSLAWHVVVLASRRGMADLAGAAWQLSGVPTAAAEGRVAPPPSWGRVTAYDNQGRPVTSGPLDRQGSFRHQLPLGEYRVELRSPGGVDEETVTLRTAGENQTVDLLAPLAGVLELRARDEEGRPLAVRWMVHGEDGTPDPQLGPTPLLEGNVAFAPGGEATVQVPAGVYRVTASRGPEHTAPEHEVTLKAGAGAVVRMAVTRVVDATGWIGCDFHLHAAPSFDSEVTLEQRVGTLLSEGIGFAVATDHNVVTDYGPTVAAQHAGRLGTAVGVEVTTRHWGHFNVFPLLEGASAPRHDGLTPAELFPAIRSSNEGTLIQVNHPWMGDIGYFRLGELDPSSEPRARAREGFSFEFDTLEVFNGFDLRDLQPVMKTLQSWYDLLNRGHRITAVGNSDSHRMITQWVGYPRTYVWVGDAATGAALPNAVVEALRRGQAMVTNGPFIDASVDGLGIGTTVPARNGRVLLRASLQSAPWVTVDLVEVVQNGEVVAVERVSPMRGRSQDLQFDLAASADSWIVVLARGDRPLDAVLPKMGARPLAFTNPIYVDADGDGYRAQWEVAADAATSPPNAP